MELGRGRVGSHLKAVCAKVGGQESNVHGRVRMNSVWERRIKRERQDSDLGGQQE